MAVKRTVKSVKGRNALGKGRVPLRPPLAREVILNLPNIDTSPGHSAFVRPHPLSEATRSRKDNPGVPKQ